MEWKLGDTSKLYEVGSKGSPGTVSSGKGDYGGVSYGLYQLSSKLGTAAEFVKVMGYSSHFRGTTPGTSMFSILWAKAAQAFPNFGEDQYEFIKKTHYDLQMDRLKKVGIDLSSKGPAVLDAVWSTSVQFGGSSRIIEEALTGKDVQAATDVDIVSAIQDYKISHNNSLFKSSSAAVRESTLSRAKKEKASLIALAEKTKEIDQPKVTTTGKGVVDVIIDAIADFGRNS